MKRETALEMLARARLEIETVALQIAQSGFGPGTGRIEEEITEARARVRALEARISVLEARGDN